MFSRLGTSTLRISKGRPPFVLLLIAGLLLAGCGVPISAADLTLTPETTPVPDAAAVVAVSSRSLDGDGGVRAFSASTLVTPAASATARATAPPGATGTAGAGATPSTTALATAATSTPTPAGTAGPTATPSPNSSGNLPADALAALNQYRTNSGRQPLRVDPALAASANAYAKVMADNNWFYCGCDFHTGPDGSQPDQRAYRAGYTGHWKGEAIAGGQGSGQQAVNTWLNSPAHAAIVLDPAATDVGIGYYYKPGDLYGHYWVLVTGSP